MAQQLFMENINKYEFYNKFIQFLYPTLVIQDTNADAKEETEEKQASVNANRMNVIFNSTILNLSADNQPIEQILIQELRDQGSEYFNKLLILSNSNGDNNIIQQICQQIANLSKSIKTFYIFLDHDEDNTFIHQHHILTEHWYNVFKSKHNTSNYVGYPSLPSMIETHLFVGGAITAQNLFILKSLNISVVINCTKTCVNYFENDAKEIIYHRIEIDDQDNENITPHLKVCYALLDKYIHKNNRKVLVHCEQGKSRSVSMVLYYLMQKHKWNVEESLKYVKNLRQTAAPNKGFMFQLQQTMT
eukprot:39733_1